MLVGREAVINFVLLLSAAAAQNCADRPAVTGPCRASFKLWTFTTSGQCVEFRYGGCKGNGNKFDTQAQCEALCSGLGEGSGTRAHSGLTHQHQCMGVAETESNSLEMLDRPP